jgi:hypothetical protein
MGFHSKHPVETHDSFIRRIVSSRPRLNETQHCRQQISFQREDSCNGGFGEESVQGHAHRKGCGLVTSEAGSMCQAVQHALSNSITQRHDERRKVSDTHEPIIRPEADCFDYQSGNRNLDSPWRSRNCGSLPADLQSATVRLDHEVELVKRLIDRPYIRVSNKWCH